ncbi:DUF4325 domain-containing protein [Methanosarcina sp. KYL-1]|uniref:STAS-like domain-containing protein n=1 Tax=Methanosarcina sp. KYL-1 TaxID=2602068 RepID=UPI002101B3E1|nr:STAS-like domain-containing protein [Methanosarcina sp. KYL-1]MCQ1535572.1 DUF4325 domain-containing protein [Methanosarcina sp. KYL-1]
MGIVTTETIKIRVIEVTEGICCVAACDGQKVHDRIAGAFRENKRVELSFEDTDDLTPAFLNAALGQLYGSFPGEFVEENLFFTGVAPEDELILKRVVERAKGYFEHADSYRQAFREVIGDEDA